MTAKRAENGEEIFGYEVVDGQVSAMNHERYLAFIQEGIDSLDRNGGVPHDVVFADIRKRLAKIAAA